MNHPETGQKLPLVPQVSQFDGGPKASENCMAASIARLRWFATGVRTSGTKVRENQSDQVGGISIPDGLRALSRMAPIIRPKWAAPMDGTPSPINRVSGSISENALRSLLDSGYMPVVPGDYGALPIEFREQKTFRGDHAMTLDARFGVKGATESLYVVDTIPRASSGYDGRIIPWSAIMSYAHALAGAGRIYATWAKPFAPHVAEWEAVIHPREGEEKREFLVYRVEDHDDRPLRIVGHETTRTAGSTYRVKPPIDCVRGPGFPKDAHLPNGLCRLIDEVPHLAPGGYLDLSLCRRK